VLAGHWIGRCEGSRQPLKAAGFSLIEVLVATAVVAVGVASLAHLIVVSAHANRTATMTSATLLLAEQKMEELLSERMPGDSGDPVNQSHVDYLDPSGASLGIPSITMPTPPPGTSYICRWSILSLPDRPTAIVIQVLVIPWPQAAGQTRLVSVKTRRAS
jgi:prepilin-type N-terminal cleavage/methylation domain-containing protein